MSMLSYISPRARIRGNVVQGALVLGPSEIGDKTYVDANTIIGYPSRDKMLRGPPCSINELDELSDGARIGSLCVLRAGCVIYEGVEVGDRVELGHGVLVRRGSFIGSGARIGSGSQLDGAVTVGEETNIQSMAYLPHLTRVGRRVFIGPNVCVTNDRYPLSSRLLGVMIEDEAVVGAGAILLAGVTVGAGAVIAAGSVVVRDVKPGEMVLGCPARPISDRRSYEEKKRRYEEAP
jgi:acetyltransferase-like isoleucine patch superfamily enzyme